MTSRRKYALLALSFSLLTVCHRLWLASSQFTLPTDTGTLGLMALRILEGDRPLFLYGFVYSGAPLAYLVAISFKIFGVSLTSLALPTAILAGLWCWLSFRLGEKIAGPRAGLAAALLVLLADRTISWYTHTPDTSFSPLLPLGTAILLVAIKIESDDLKGWHLAATAFFWGALCGLGFWIHALAVPYILTSCIPPAILIIRRRCAPWTLLSTAAAVPGALLAAFPTCNNLISVSHGPTLAWRPSLERITTNLRVLVAQTLPQFFNWTISDSRFILPLSIVFTAAVLIIGLIALSPYRTIPNRWRRSLPLILIIIFLLLYLPHPMAGLGIPRYVLPLFATILFFGLALPSGNHNRKVRLAGTALLALWCLCNLVGAIRLVPDGRQDRTTRLRRRHEIIAAAQNLGKKHITLIGDYYFMSEANSLTFLARQDIIFVSASNERCLPLAQATARQTEMVYLPQHTLLPTIRTSLKSLGATWKEHYIDDLATLIYDLKPPPASRRLLSTVTPAPSDYTSHRQLDPANPTSVKTLTIDLDDQMVISGIELVPPQPDGYDLPTHIQFEVSTNSAAPYAYSTLIPFQKHVAAYTAGDGVFIGGGQGRLRLSFPPIAAHRVRLSATLPDGSPFAIPRNPELTPDNPPTEWEVAYMHLFGLGAEPPHDLGSEVREIAEFVDESEAYFVIADRRLSAYLLSQDEIIQPSQLLPLFEDSADLQGDGSRLAHIQFQPLAETAAVVATEYADSQQAILNRVFPGASPAWVRINHGHYTTFLFAPPPGTVPPLLTWDGAMLRE